MSHVARAIERDETAGLMKIIVDASNDRILGASIFATEGGELIHVLYTLMLGNLPYTAVERRRLYSSHVGGRIFRADG